MNLKHKKHEKKKKKKNPLNSKAHQGTLLVVQWLRFLAPKAGGLGSTSSQVTRSHMPQPKILHATTKNWYGQIKKEIKEIIKEIKEIIEIKVF